MGFATLASGRIQATAKMRDEVGDLRRLKASGHTQDEALQAITKQAEDIRYRTVGPVLGRDATIAEACAVFLYDKRTSTRSRTPRSTRRSTASKTSSNRPAGT